MSNSQEKAIIVDDEPQSSINKTIIKKKKISSVWNYATCEVWLNTKQKTAKCNICDRYIILFYFF